MSEPQSPYSSGSENPGQTPPNKDPYSGTKPDPNGEKKPDPYGGTKPQETPKDPCDEPKPPDYTPPEKEPCPPEPRPCPPKEEPCPPSKPCPEPPGRPTPPSDPYPPDPDPCEEEPTPPTKYPGEEQQPGDETKPDDGSPYEPKKPDDGTKPDDGKQYREPQYSEKPGEPYPEKDQYGEKEPYGEEEPYGEKEPKKPYVEKAPPEGGKKYSSSQPSDNGVTQPAGKGPGDHLAQLKAKLESELTQLQQLEPLKISTADLAQRIAALEKALEGQPAAAASYKEFYRAIEVLRSEIKCFIPTVRCQLDEIKDKHRKCICEAIAAVDERVRKANRDSARANKLVRELEAKWNHATRTLEWAKKYYEFLKTGLQQQLTKHRDDLKALKGLADPKKDQCEVWFYLYELEAALESKRTKDDKGGVCWRPDQNLATFLDCWGWECYEKSWNWAVVEFNTAEADEKLLKSQLEQAKKRATDLDKIAKEAQSKRREWIVKEIKAKDCCGPTSKCP